MLTAGPRDDDRFDILPGMRLSQVVEEALQHCRQQGRRAEWAWPGAVSEASGYCPIASRSLPEGCRAFTGGLWSVTTATPSATSRVVWGAILATQMDTNPPKIEVRLAGGDRRAQEWPAGRLTWRLLRRPGSFPYALLEKCRKHAFVVLY